ncbi:MAG TPA: phospho-N-acetylmuramoyl-pentapeptide-transferase [Abditibacteriaceae bacterium]|nr:phospho-N-acetylmuramoyl-pentapeptide-transferase [Abditibacteriaceae bacterium]
MQSNSPGTLQWFLQALATYVTAAWTLPLLMFCCAMTLMLLLGRPMIDWLRPRRWRKDAATWTVREDTPDTHLVKQGTPSMGGIGIVVSAIVTFIALLSTLFGLAYFDNMRAYSTLTATYPLAQVMMAVALLPVVVLAHAVLGFVDDWSKATGRGGLRARAKLLAQIVLALGFLTAWCLLAVEPSYTGIRFFTDIFAGPEWLLALSLVIIVGVLVGVCNAVNLTDGIDGLAAGLAVQAGAAFFLAGANLYEIGFVTIIFWSALSGACLGFLWYNKHPARVFMGDTGSLAIGAALGAGAVLMKAVFLLPFIGFIYFAEMLSVLLQVGYFKWTRRQTGAGKRIFRRTPLHHHFELGGWSEWRVVFTFWLVNLATTIVGLGLWSRGVLPRWP